MDTLTPSLAVLSAMITPAVLISACGTLILSTSQRLGRVIERVQKWSDRLATAVAAPADGAPSRDEIALIFAQLRDTTRRARLLQLGLTTFYLAVGVFVADMVVIGVMSLTSDSDIWPTVGLGLLGAILLFLGCIALILESRIALATTFREMEFVRSRGEARVPSEVRRRPSLLSRFRRLNTRQQPSANSQ
jgi:hypothetical protein